MAEYIEREAAKKEFNLNFGGVSHAVIANRILDAIPAADVQPVAHGRWIDTREYCGDYMCSNCKELYRTNVFNYCPNCGARMDGE